MRINYYISGTFSSKYCATTNESLEGFNQKGFDIADFYSSEIEAPTYHRSDEQFQEEIDNNSIYFFSSIPQVVIQEKDGTLCKKDLHNVYLYNLHFEKITESENGNIFGVIKANICTLIHYKDIHINAANKWVFRPPFVEPVLVIDPPVIEPDPLPPPPAPPPSGPTIWEVVSSLFIIILLIFLFVSFITSFGSGGLLGLVFSALAILGIYLVIYVLDKVSTFAGKYINRTLPILSILYAIFVGCLFYYFISIYSYRIAAAILLIALCSLFFSYKNIKGNLFTNSILAFGNFYLLVICLIFLVEKGATTSKETNLASTTINQPKPIDYYSTCSTDSIKKAFLEKSFFFLDYSNRYHSFVVSLPIDTLLQICATKDSINSLENYFQSSIYDKGINDLHQKLQLLQLKKNLNRNDFLYLLIRFVQAIPVDQNSTNIIPPAFVLYNNIGNEISLSILLFELLKHFGYDVIMLNENNNNKVILGINFPPASGNYKLVNGVKFYLVTPYKLRYPIGYVDYPFKNSNSLSVLNY